MKNVIYKGYFLDEKSSNLLKEKESGKKLEKDIPNIHVTFELHPKELFPDDVLNKVYGFQVVGYGNDGKNSGYQVLLPEELAPYYAGKEVVHITTSMCIDGQAKNTAFIDYQPIKPFQITGQLGYLINKRGIVLNHSDLKISENK